MLTFNIIIYSNKNIIMNLEEVNSEKNGKKTSKKSDETSSEEDEALLLKNDIKRW